MTDQFCRFCGCTEARACPGGCAWHKPSYCSACAEQHLSELLDEVVTWIAPAKNKPIPATLTGKPCTIVESDESLTVFDHIGVIAFAFSPQGAYLAPQYDARELMPLFTDHARAA